MSASSRSDLLASLAHLLDTLPIVAWIARPDGTLTFMSQRWFDVTGTPRDALLGLRYVEAIFIGDRERAVATWRAALAAGTPYRDELRMRYGDGSFRWVLSAAAPVREADGTIAAWFGTVTDIDDRKHREAGLRLLSATGAAAARSLDYAGTLQNLADALIEEFASYCVIDVHDDDHPWERIAAHADAEVVPRLIALSRPGPEHDIADVLRDGRSRAVTIDGRWITAVDAADDRVALIRERAVRSVIIVPVRSPDGRVLGAITVGLDRSDDTGRVYVEGDVPFVEEVGRRAGAAIVNARLFERQQRIASELQRAFLPGTLPQLHGVALDAYYRPGSDEAAIGGDWYDAFAVDARRLVVSVGDVRGHGLAAAITMTKLRQAMQAAAMVRPDPRAMLDVADRTMRAIDPESFATAVAATFDTVSGELLVTSAGHPPPLLAASGAVEELRVGGPMLGLGGSDDRMVDSRRLAPGSLAIFYTDGLAEVRRDLAGGLERIRGAIAAHASAGIVRAADLVGAVLADHVAPDDVAVLTLAVTNSG